jgi:hypothetical protein
MRTNITPTTKKQRLTVGSTQAKIVFVSQMSSGWAYDQPESSNDYVRFYADKLLIENGCALEPISLSCQVLSPLLWHENTGGARTEQRSILSTIVKSTLGFEGINDCLFRQSEPWLVEDFAMSDVWYIALQAYTSSAFRKVFQEHLYRYLPPFNELKTVTLDHMFESTFDIASIVEQVKSASSEERNDFLVTLIVKGTPPMFAPFLNAGIDPDEGIICNNYLGNASVCGNVGAMDMLINAGATCALALPQFLSAAQMEVAEFDAIYSKLLDNMIRPERKILSALKFHDPINRMLGSGLAMETHPDAPKKLLEQGLFQPDLILGSSYFYICHSYVYNAISYDRPAFLAWLLDFGADPQDIIQDIFETDREHFQILKRYSWLTMAVELGRTACVEVFLKDAENTFDAASSQDGAGRCAISLARSFSGMLHPRVPSLQHPCRFQFNGVSAADDASTLALLETALQITSERPSTTKSGRRSKVRRRYTCRGSPFFGRPSTHSTILQSVLTHSAPLLAAILRFIDFSSHIISTIAHTQLSHCIKDQFNQLWQMSSIEALLVRFAYLIAYCILFCHQLMAFTMFLTRLPRQSEFHLIAKVCLVALVLYVLKV